MEPNFFQTELNQTHNEPTPEFFSKTEPKPNRNKQEAQLVLGIANRPLVHE